MIYDNVSLIISLTKWNQEIEYEMWKLDYREDKSVVDIVNQMNILKF